MNTTGQGMQIGDAVMNFLADTTQLDQAVARTKTEAEQLGASFKTAGAQGTVAGTAITEGAEMSRKSVREARGEAALLGEAFGIHLPRHVRSFLAELPGVGTALSAAFSATAIFFVIEALVQAGEKIAGLIEKPQKIAEAWHHYDQTVFESGERIRGEIDKEEQKLIEMTQGPVAALDFAFKHLQTSAFESLSSITKATDAAIAAMKEQKSFFNVFGDAAKDLGKFRDELETTMRVAAQAHPEDPLAAYNAGMAAVQQKERELTALIKQRTAASGADASAAVNGIHAERQAVNDMLPVLQKGLELQRDKAKDAKQELADATATKQAAEAKRALDQQIADIENWKALRHAAYVSGKTDLADWKAAEVEAASTVGAAHEVYLARLVAIYRQSGELEKAHTAAEELVAQKTKDAAKFTEEFAKAQEHYNEQAAHTRREWGNLIQLGIEREWQKATVAAKALTDEELRLNEAQTRLKENQITQQFKDQEIAVEHLAEFGLITEQQKQQKLAALYAQEKAQALKALQDLLIQEKALIDAAQAKLVAGRGNPIFTDAQLMDLKKNLVQAETAYAHTFAQIEKVEKHYDVELAKTQKLSHTAWNQMIQDLHHGVSGITQLKDVGVQAFDDLTKSLEASVAAAILGTDSFGAAMEKALASALANIAGQALVKALFYTAEGFAALAGFEEQSASEYFTAAGIMAAVGGAAAVAGHALAGATSKSSAPSGTTNPVSTPAGVPGAAPSQGMNVPHLAGGALITAPTLALVGDHPSGGSRPEAIIPLGDPRAMRQLAAALGEYLGQGGAGGTVNHIYNGAILDVNKLLRLQSQHIQRGKGRSLSSNSLRVTKRS